MALRIFEPRYVRMVKEACANNTTFVLCMLNSQGNESLNQHIQPIGTECQVIDFDLMDDGFLGIKVMGLTCVAIDDIEIQHDQLRTGRCQMLKPWNGDVKDTEIAPLRDKLKAIYSRYPEIANLYPELKFNDPIWVIYRWLELLPVDATNKQRFLNEQSCKKVLDYINTLNAG